MSVKKFLIALIIFLGINSLEKVTLNDVVFSIPSKFRYKIYEKEINDFASLIADPLIFPEIDGEGFSSGFLTGSGVLEQLVIVLDKIVVQHFFKDFMPYSMNHFIDMTEEELFFSISKEKSFLKENEIVPGQESAALLLMLRSRFVEEFARECNEMKKYLQATLAIVEPESLLIRKVFLKNDFEFRLNRIWPASADQHQKHLKVSFLEFTRDTGADEIIVFKPSTMLPDYAIAGDITELCKLEDEFIQTLCGKLGQSYFEIVNNNFGFSDMEKIPTIRVLPIEDWSEPTNVPKRMKMAHGYIQFIPSDFSYCIDNTIKVYEEFWKNDLSTLQRFNLNKLLTIMEAKKLQTSGDKLSKPEVQKKYWDAKETMFSLLYMIRSSDIHDENVISSRGRSWAIDLENSLSFVAQQPLYLAYGEKGESCAMAQILFEKEQKVFFSYSLESLTPVTAVCLENVFDEVSQTSVPNIKQIRQMSYTKPNIDKSVRSEFAKHHGKFLEWVNSDLVSNLIIREVPIGTSVLYNAVLAAELGRGEVLLRRSFDTELKSESKRGPDDRQVSTIFTEKLLSTVTEGIIPSFFIHVQQTELYFQDGTAVNKYPHLFIKPNEMVPGSALKPYTIKSPKESIIEFWKQQLKGQTQKIDILI